MSWQLGAFAVLALALAAGFAWYERSQPDARVVALVATLAAFAALGRIAFAAVPNVKPTTDIVLISGYALGGAPGFVVGAVAGLSSNFFFGQGPFTPWQMAGWGATGLIGAGLARVVGGPPRRWLLAAVCAVTGFAFTAFQDVGDWVNYSDHSVAQLGVSVGKGVGWDFVHAAGCVAFALALGPALARSLRRFTARLEVNWLPIPGVGAGGGPSPRAGGGPSAGAGAVVAALAIAFAAHPAPARAAGATPTSYLLAAQNGDGGFGPAPGQPSATLESGWTALGLAAEGRNPQDVSRAGRTLWSYVAAAPNPDPGSLERTILVAAAAGIPASSVGGHDLTADLLREVRGDGSVSEQTNVTTFAILALRAAGVSAPRASTRWLAGQQNADGGFGYGTRGGGSDIDDTGAALEALSGLTLAGGPASPDGVSRRAVRFLRSQQNPDGGFPSQPGGPSNAQSTAWAVQGLIAAGVPLGTLRHGSPAQYLSSLIASDGHVRYSRSTDQTPVWVTAEAMMALAGKPLPLGAVARASSTPPRATVRRPVTQPTVRRPEAGRRATRRRVSGRSRAAAGSPTIDQLATDAGVVLALVLAMAS